MCPVSVGYFVLLIKKKKKTTHFWFKYSPERNNKTKQKKQKRKEAMTEGNCQKPCVLPQSAKNNYSLREST